MPLFADLIAALAAGALTYLMARWYANSSATPARPAVEVARAAGEAMRPHPRLRRLVVRHLDRTAATGFLLTLALSITLLGGLALGVLAFLVRRVAFIQRFDNVVAAWGYDHRSATSTNGLHALTDLGRLEIVVVLALALVAFAVIRVARPLVVSLSAHGARRHGGDHARSQGSRRPRRSDARPGGGIARPVVPEWTLLDVGRVLRRRCALMSGATSHGGRDRSRSPASRSRSRSPSTASRVLLDLHWLSDVIAGLSLGWAWFALCSVVFGGRLLIPTAGVKVAAAEAAAPVRRIRPQSRAQARKQPTPSDRHHVRQGLPTGRNRQGRSGPDPPALLG